MYKCEEVLPYGNQGEKKRQQVENMFDSISGAYDKMNRMMTLSRDIEWRRKAIDSLKDFDPKKILDIATGTGDFAIESCNRLAPDSVMGVDISEKMMEVGKEKVAKLGLQDKISFRYGDSLSLEFGDASFDAVTIAFGVRNFQNLEVGLKEMSRVLRPGGRLVILEMSEPYKIFKPFYWLYAKVVIPFIGRMMSKNDSAYGYLPASISVFPHGKPMFELLEKVGMTDVKRRRFTFGVCSLYLATKK